MINWFKGLFSGGFSALWSKILLWLGYITIGVALALGCAAVWFYKQNTILHETVGTLQTSQEQLRSSVAQAQSNLATQKQALDDLAAVRQRDSEVMMGLVQTIGGIVQDTKQTKSALRQLKEHSDEAKAYLNTPLPASVRSVLAGQADNAVSPRSGPSGKGEAAGGSASTGTAAKGH